MRSNRVKRWHIEYSSHSVSTLCINTLLVLDDTVFIDYTHTVSNMADYQQSFQDFMLGRSSAPGSPPAVSTSLPSPSSSANRQQQQRKRNQKQTGSVFKAFVGRLEEWTQLDDQMFDILQSIHNLRTRLAWEQQQLKQLRVQNLMSTAAQQLPAEAVAGTRTNETPPCHGFLQANAMAVMSSTPQRPTTNDISPTALTEDDVSMAYNADLRRHERMITLLRSQMGSLSQIQDAMGRRLDEWMSFEMESAAFMDDGSHGNIEAPPGSAANYRLRLSHCERIFAHTSKELFRKQILAQRLFDSYDGLQDESNGCKDGVVDGGAVGSGVRYINSIDPHGGGIDDESGPHMSSRRTAKECVVAWQSKQRSNGWSIVEEILKC
uniref:Uncharacterized protein n=1 Tax=Craspedostauros australis TaxID=1486917 RepID=A0A7S0F7D1_9STRA|mmetsp:Transcript_9632/g.26209  ORF Transcript_9632/g.26209 Transcript_9632/m.26209 type:complete len:378 (+) Transcript_9632:42-1175(+)